MVKLTFKVALSPTRTVPPSVKLIPSLISELLIVNEAPFSMFTRLAAMFEFLKLFLPPV